MRLAPTSAGMQLLPSSKQHAATCPRTPPAVHAAARRLRRCQKQRSALQATEQPTGVAPASPPPQASSPTWQKCNSFLPPLGRKSTELLQIEEGVWVLRQDFFSGDDSFNAFNNCFIIDMGPAADGLLLISPISMTEEAAYLMSTIPGQVKWIVCNSVSPEHWLYIPDTLARWPDATVWACPGISTASWLLGLVPGGPGDIMKGLQARVRRSDGSAPLLRTIEPGPTPCCPPELNGDVQFVVFQSDPPLLSEACVLIKSRRAIVLGDMGFKQSDDLYASLPALPKLLNDQVKVAGQLAAPIPHAALLKNPELGAAWKAKVMAWPEWDRLFCCHLQPVVPDGRRELDQCFSWLDKTNVK